MKRAFFVIVLLCLGGLVVRAFVFPGQPVQISGSIQLPENEAATPQTVAAYEPPTKIDVEDFLTAYRNNEVAANAKYDGKEVELTGKLTGVFIPPIATQLRMAGEGHHADAFVTLGGPLPTSPEETLFLPGVLAYSDEDSLFGTTGPNDLTNLGVGSTVTLLCKCQKGSPALAEAYKDDYLVELEGCKIRAITPDDMKEAQRIYSLMDKNYADHPAVDEQPLQQETPAPIERRDPSTATQ